MLWLSLQRKLFYKTHFILLSFESKFLVMGSLLFLGWFELDGSMPMLELSWCQTSQQYLMLHLNYTKLNKVKNFRDLTQANLTNWCTLIISLIWSFRIWQGSCHSAQNKSPIALSVVAFLSFSSSSRCLIWMKSLAWGPD
jgi:hypothetical protein